MLRSSVTKRLRSSRKREEGQTTAEYGVVLTLITLALLTAFTVLSG